MVNLEHKLTVDDLIVEYMMSKIINGYNPSFTVSEFIDFLHFFEGKMKVEDSIYDGKQLFERFFERKNENDWFGEPHLDMSYVQEDNDYIIKANKRFSTYDSSVINTYFMDNGRGKFDDYKGQVYQIRCLINDYLSNNQNKRELKDSIEVSDNELLIGKYAASEIINNIWESYVDDLIKNNRWPRQCKDINKYLFEIDLANIIEVKSIKNELLELYRVLSKRIAIMYHDDNELKISMCSGDFLSVANYELLINDYEDIMSIAFGEYKKSLSIDFEKNFFIESHEKDGIYFWDEDADIEATEQLIENENARTLSKRMDSSINK